MSDAPALNEWEEEARAQLVALCREMLSGQTSFLEGTVQVTALRAHIREHDHDPDMIPFSVVRSETDHLPLRRVRPLCSAAYLRSLEPEFESKEQWAKAYASEARENLIRRFGPPRARLSDEASGHDG